MTTSLRFFVAHVLRGTYELMAINRLAGLQASSLFHSQSSQTRNSLTFISYIFSRFDCSSVTIHDSFLPHSVSSVFFALPRLYACVTFTSSPANQTTAVTTTTNQVGSERDTQTFIESVWAILYHSLEACYYTSLLPLRLLMVCLITVVAWLVGWLTG